MAIVGIVGAAQSLVILTAGIDLSVGAIMVLSSVVMGQFTFRYGLPAELSIICGLAVGAFCGFINGVLVSRMRLPPFIVTLGMWQIVLATNFLYSANETIRSQDIVQQAPILQFFGNNIRIGSAVFTYGVIAMVLLVALLWYVLNRTARGRHLYAVGDDPDAAELAGVNVKRMLTTVYTFRAYLCLRGLGSHRPHRLGIADRRSVRQYRIHHRSGHRRHIAVWRTRLDHGHDLRRADRRCLLSRPATYRNRPTMDLSVDRRPYHLGCRNRPVDQKGSRLMAKNLSSQHAISLNATVV